MIVDSSAIIAILNDEIGNELYREALEHSANNVIATPTYLELCMVGIGSRAQHGQFVIDGLLQHFRITKIAFTVEMADVAISAFLRFGKGRNHPAKLNFGDCISYAASKIEGMPLLFKGNDFRLTDVECAV